ncbi:hypothetical protein HD597_011691 [Nonomuraea thailandensis]|uniref:Uncharacterized protein n=1 Tax=Nonomuraea thailandensis TaxID=1188745 RepID=A0A9X2GT46_9ACTN|nr:hypothetical protein [Nonomuraea thailandensis]MCP2364671.1 hypothetical protein [Nonomuraea thailandensis]
MSDCVAFGVASARGDERLAGRVHVLPAAVMKVVMCRACGGAALRREIRTAKGNAGILAVIAVAGTIAGAK